MKSLFFNRAGLLSVLAALFCSLPAHPVLGQACPITFPPSPANELTAYVTIYPGYKVSLTIQQQLTSFFTVDVSNTVSGPNPPIPYGLYPTWCVDTWDFINPTAITVPGSIYSGFLYSTCDPDLNAELPPGHPNTLVSAADWQMVNYILNHQGCAGGTNAFYWDVQAAINTLVGSGLGDTEYCGTPLKTPIPDGCGGYPKYDSNVVECLLMQATNNAPTWTPKCGDVYGVIYVTEPFTDQFLLLEVPIPCPKLHIGTIGACYSSPGAAEAAAIAATTVTGGCGSEIYTASASGTCPATITVTGVDACGDVATATTTAYILTSPPTLIGVPSTTTMNFQCYSDIPPIPTVTATDSCNRPVMPVNLATSTNQTGPCSYVVTWTWMVQDCASNEASFTETITVQNTTAPTLTQIGINNCYTTLSAAISAATAATSGTANCGGPVTFTASANGGYCPATITVTGTDNCGLSSMVTYTVKILTNGPTMSGVPPNTNYQCLTDVPAEAVVAVADACGLALTVGVTDVTNVNLAAPCSWTITRTWSATDCAGQPVSETQTIAVQDTTLPGVTQGPIGTCYTSMTTASNAALKATTFTATSCGGAITTNVTVLGTCSATITVMGTDACGNSASVTYTTTILTNTPTLNGVPGNGSYQCLSQVPAEAGVTATDSCGNSLSVSVSDKTNATSLCGYTIIRTWSAADCAGQPVSETQTITVLDTTLPTVTKGSISSCYTSVTAATTAALNATIFTPTLCGGAVIPSVAVSGTCPAIITVTGTDSCGKSVSVTYSAYILTTPPVLSSAPGNANYQCLSQVPAEAIVTATDACLGPLTVIVTDTTNSTSLCGYTITRIWGATDCAGQTTTETNIITVLDTTLPTATKGSISSCYTSATSAENDALGATVFTSTLCGGAVTPSVSISGTCPATITVTGTDSCGKSVSVTYSTKILTALPTLTGVPANGSYQCLSQVPAEAVVTAMDSCKGVLPVSVTDKTNATSLCGYTITRTWKTTDCAGQTASGTQTITVQDTALPGVTKGAINSCYSSVSAATTAALNMTIFTPTLCGGAVTPSVSVSGTCPAIITVTGTDSCGKSVSVTYSAKILTAPPTLTGVPPNTTVQCPSEIPNPATVTAMDSCGLALIVGYNQVESNPSSTCSNVIKRTWSVTDCAGQTTTSSQVITQYDNVAATLTCPTNITIITNLCQMYCTFSCGDWNGSCDGGSRSGGWWQGWCGKSSSSPCSSAWTGWWTSCGASSSQCGNCWNNWAATRPTSCWGSWTSSAPSGWWGSWSGGGGGWGSSGGGWGSSGYGSQCWVPCGGNNPDNVLNNCYKQVYPSGCVTVGLPGNCVTLTSCSAVQNCLGINGSPGSLKGSCVNPSSCSAGSFCAQVLALRLNCDFGDYGCVPGFVGKCGDLVLCDSTSPCNGKKVRDILSLCDCAVSGGSCPSGCTPQYLTTLCSNLNQCFEGCQPSSWCSTHLCSVYVPSPSQSGTATVTTGCTTNVTVTYCDTIKPGACSASYVISREWIAVDVCNNSNTCTQLITILGKCQANQICGNFNSQNPGKGYCWFNAHLNCNPGKKCTVYCQNASVTLTCNDGKTYTFPVPDCQINFSPSCSSGSCQFDGTKWATTVPCSGDDQIFLSGCGIPWQSDFANCRSVCWNGNFCSDTPGVNCNWQWSSACYNCDLSKCGSINVKPCHNVPCGYAGGDQCGTPENCKSFCQGGACGGGGGNYTGSWSGTGSFSCN